VAGLRTPVESQHILRYVVFDNGPLVACVVSQRA
jgi:hypothetical protein